MKLLLRLFPLIMILTLLAGCVMPVATPTAVSVAGETPAATEEATSEPVSEPAGAAPFPVTIDHKYGSTTITQKPERIVTVGLTDHDSVLALGTVPVGVTEWIGAFPSEIGPWAEPLLNGAPLPEVVGDSGAPNLEKIAALQPDLILALYAGITQEQYELLTQIAPTVAQPADYVDYGIPWQELTRTVGKALGQTAEAEALIAGIEEKFAQARADHPEFEGAVGIVAYADEDGFWLYSPEDPRSRILTALGFARSTEADALMAGNFAEKVSLEQIHLVDVDLLEWAWGTPGEDILALEVYTKLPVHTEGRDLYASQMGDDMGTAFSFITVLSLPYMIDRLVPQIALAVDGDPATEALPATTP